MKFQLRNIQENSSTHSNQIGKTKDSSDSSFNLAFPVENSSSETTFPFEKILAFKPSKIQSYPNLTSSFPMPNYMPPTNSNCSSYSENAKDKNISSINMDALSISEPSASSSMAASKSKSDTTKTLSKGPSLFRKTYSSYKTPPIRYRKSHNTLFAPTIPLSISPMKKQGMPLQNAPNSQSRMKQEKNLFFSSPDRFVLRIPHNVNNSRAPSPPIMDELNENVHAFPSLKPLRRFETLHSLERSKKMSILSAPVALRPRLRRYIRGKILNEASLSQQKQYEHSFSTPEKGHNDVVYPVGRMNPFENDKRSAYENEPFEKSFIPIREDSPFKVSFRTPINYSNKKQDSSFSEQTQDGKNEFMDGMSDNSESLSFQFTTPSKQIRTKNQMTSCSSSLLCTPMSTGSRKGKSRTSSFSNGSHLFCTPTDPGENRKATKPHYDKHHLMLPALAIP